MDPRLFLQHLSPGDLAVLARRSGFSSIDDLVTQLRSEPDSLHTLLSDPRLSRCSSVFPSPADSGTIARILVDEAATT